LAAELDLHGCCGGGGVVWVVGAEGFEDAGDIVLGVALGCWLLDVFSSRRMAELTGSSEDGAGESSSGDEGGETHFDGLKGDLHVEGK
jgi:hypothetical protein